MKGAHLASPIRGELG